MNLLNAFVSSPITEPVFSEPSAPALSRIPGIDPLWTDTDKNRAVVIEVISPDKLGRVKFQGTRWRAWSDRPFQLEAGTAVRVIGRKRCNILIVEPIYSTASVTR